MFCGCQGSKKAKQMSHEQNIDSPLQMRLIKSLGLQSFMLEKFVFRRKQSSYTIKNVKGINTLYLKKHIYLPPDQYSISTSIIQTEKHSVPIVRLAPLILKKNEILPVIVYIHGNSSDLGDSLRFIASMTDHFKAQYVTFDFTGYGQSRKSNVGEEIIRGDLQLVLAWLGLPLSRIILWGFSLGTYPVVYNAAKYDVHGVILQCPIGSLSCMFYDQYDNNVKFKDDHFANIDHIAEIKSKILMMHSMADEIIPVQQARLLYNKYVAVNGNSLIDYIQVEKIKHNSFHRYILSANTNDLQAQLLEYLKMISFKIHGQNYLKEEQDSTEEQISQDRLTQLKQEIKEVKFQEEEFFQEQTFQLQPTETKGSSSRSLSKVQDYPGWMCCKR